MKDDIWEILKEEFDEKIPRRTAILVKEEDYSLSFAYPSAFGCTGYLFDCRQTSTYEESPFVSINFGEYSFPDLTGKNLSKNIFYFEDMKYFPSLIKRKIVFSNIGIEAEEKFGQVIDGSFSWEINLICKNHPPFIFDRRLYTIVTINGDNPEIEYHPDKKLFEVKLDGKRIFIASDFENYAIYRGIDDYLRDLKTGKINSKEKNGNYIVIEHSIKLSPQEIKRLRFGISTHSAEKALEASMAEGYEDKIKDRWNSWFLSLYHPEFKSDAELKAYYKCWWTIRLNYYDDERYGKTVIEALPVYRGYWQWGLPAVQWHTSLNPEVDSFFMKRLIDLFLGYQRKDGYVTHAIYLDEETPGEKWGRGNIIQTPHIPWVALRYYYVTKDMESLRRWYPKLKKYYQYLCQSRDENFLKLHLWGIISSYDTGMDDYPPLQRVTFKDRGEEGKGEDFCYPTIFAAERCYYEKAMGKISEILGNSREAENWYIESQKTQEKMDEILWDKEKRWYGVLHEDGTLETIIGVDGLFPFAYRLVNREKAEEAKENFIKLIGRYGIFTVSPFEERFHEETYWQGPAWTLSCAYGMATCFNYYPDLIEKVKEGLINFILKYPGIWEGMSARTGKICRGPQEVLATPVVSSNVGAGEALGALLIYYGKNVFSIENI